jgi:hypothetical protein
MFSNMEETPPVLLFGHYLAAFRFAFERLFFSSWFSHLPILIRIGISRLRTSSGLLNTVVEGF